ncbi:Dabb family protein [Halodesulfovibrio spirochaetisodalis]|uniref:Stress responsive protein n=1 Tax=Halodesulfovibrio spirochaetisodalis TaxID=1560234 RepID=A0A1B7XH03_9BACT|nr:Dabb family protein [Halodesulfovibrio spirochaetisodalis]OBQ54802.1 stress responsive protein [Halodesulfovibrio spirochaetisodalis]
MIKHIVWFTFKEEAEGATASENAAKAVSMLRNLEGKIPSLKTIDVSMEFASTTTEDVQVVLLSTHDDEEGLANYNQHRLHVECVNFIKKVIASRKAIDFVV